MTEPHVPDNQPSRRAILKLLGVTGVAAGGGYGVARTLLAGGEQRSLGRATPATTSPVFPASTTSTTQASASPVPPVADRVLVVVELEGGNDGLSTVVPIGNGRLHDLRPELAIGEDRLIPLTDGVGLHQGLAPIHDRGLMVVQGIGSAHPDGSHFEMRARWWAGNSDTAFDSRTGFLGRLCDTLDQGAPITGVSLGHGPSPALESLTAHTTGLNDTSAAWFLADPDPWYANLRDGLAAMSNSSATESAKLASAHEGIGNALSFGAILAGIDESATDNYPDTELGVALRAAATILDSRSGVRVIHVPTDGYDTHADQRSQHDSLMSDLGSSLAAFLDDLSARGLADRTLVMTTSEFGRRAQQNGTGTDHGTAGPALLCGPIQPGVVGEDPGIGNLDENGNLVATATLEDYYASIAQGWFEIDSGRVLPKGSQPVAGAISF